MNKKRICFFICLILLSVSIPVYGQEAILQTEGNVAGIKEQINQGKTDYLYLEKECQNLIKEAEIETKISVQNLKRRNEICSKGNIEFENGEVYFTASDLIYLADEIDSLENTYKSGLIDSLNKVGTFFKKDGTITYNSNENEIISEELKKEVSLGSIKQGIQLSQSVESLSKIQATDSQGKLLYYKTDIDKANENRYSVTTTDTGFPVFYKAVEADNLTAGTAAWVNGLLIKGNGMDNTICFNSGIDFADGRVNTESASYKEGHAKGIIFADRRVNTESASYKDGYTKGIIFADGRVNRESASYKDGYNNGYTKGIIFADGRVNTESASYKGGYTKGIIFADGRVNTESESYKDGHNKGIAFADNRVNSNSVSYAQGYMQGLEQKIEVKKSKVWTDNNSGGNINIGTHKYAILILHRNQEIYNNIDAIKGNGMLVSSEASVNAQNTTSYGHVFVWKDTESLVYPVSGYGTTDTLYTLITFN